MKRILLDPILRQELGVALSNAAVGLVLAAILGIASSLWWVGLLAAVGTGVAAAISDRHPAGGAATGAVLVGLVVGLVWLWVAGQPALAALPLVLMGTGLGFGVNRLVFGVVRPVPELRRERQRAQDER
jgi:hypothetical protein